jgi:periplasmic protein CpxP/Spy
MIKRFSRPLQALSVAAVMSLAAVGVQSVQAQARPDAPPAQGKDQGPGRGERMQPGPGFGPGMPGGPGPMFLDGRILKDVGASEAQRKQIRDIFEAARKDLKAQHEGGRQLHDQLEALMTAPTVDAAAVEQLRQQMTAQHEAASKRISQAMVDAAKVLTAEQRAKLAVELKKHKARMEKRMEHLREQGGRGGPRGGDGPHGDHDMDTPPPPKG